MNENEKRGSFGSRLGFILVSAGCAVGIGNVWKFPYVAGANGGAVFVLIYLVFLVLMGIPFSMPCKTAISGLFSRKSRSIADSFGCSVFLLTAYIVAGFAYHPLPDSFPEMWG